LLLTSAPNDHQCSMGFSSVGTQNCWENDVIRQNVRMLSSILSRVIFIIVDGTITGCITGGTTGDAPGGRQPLYAVTKKEADASAAQVVSPPLLGNCARATGHHDRRTGLQLTAGDAGGVSAREGNVHGASRREEMATARSEQRPAHSEAITCPVRSTTTCRIVFFINSAMDCGAAVAS
jgi:hypothetical protein